MTKNFTAPWSTSLKIISWTSTLVLLGITWGIPLPNGTLGSIWWVVRGLPVIILSGCALWTVRGYYIGDGALQVQRLFWRTRIPLQNLTGAEFRPGSFGWAWRMFGNGGLFSFSGWFYQKPMGHFRALATRTTEAVILTFSDRKPIVVTPESPERFVEAIQAAAVRLG